MEKITDYILLSAFNPNDLSTKMKEAIGKGWIPYGSLNVTFGKVVLDKNSGSANIMNEGVLFTQAVIKY